MLMSMFSYLPSLTVEPAKVPVPEEAVLLMNTVPVIQVQNVGQCQGLRATWMEPVMKPYLHQSELSWLSLVGKLCYHRSSTDPQ